MKKIKVVLDWFANTNHTGYFAALEKGYYRREGLDVEVHGEVHGVMTMGDADIVVSPQPSIMENMLAGENITTVAVQAQRGDSGIVSLKEAGIQRPRDLTGKRLTHWKPAWFHKVVGKAVNDDGGDYTKVRLIEKDVGDIEDALGRYTDAVWIYKNWEYYVMVHAGHEVNYFAFVDYGPVYNFLAPGLTATHKLIEGDPEALRSFLGATGRGFQDAAKDPDEGAALLIPHMDGNWSRELILDSQRYISQTYLDENGCWGTIAPERWDVFADWSVQQGLFDRRPQREYTNDFLR
jgi:ABC-type nitrate/sulfonate/bicarbonate transport system substrate-binding protein